MNVVLNKRCRLEFKVPAPDPDFGTDAGNYAHLATVFAEVKDVRPSNAESVTSGVAIAKNKTLVTIRYRSDVDSSMRMTIWRPGPITYQIIDGPAELGEKEYCAFMVERISS